MDLEKRGVVCEKLLDVYIDNVAGSSFGHGR